MNLRVTIKESLVHFSANAQKIIIQNEHITSESKVFVNIKDDESNTELYAIQVPCEYYCDTFCDVLTWKNLVYIGINDFCHVVNLDTQEVSTIKLKSYFHSFYPTDNHVFSCSASHICCFNHKGEFFHRTEKLGVEHVVIKSVEDGIITGSGNWGAPKGWQPYTVNYKDALNNNKEKKAGLLKKIFSGLKKSTPAL